MRRAERKLKLSHNITGDEDATDGKGKDLGNEASDMRSMVFGLHLFDPTETTAETINEETLAKLETMSEKVVKMRSHEPSEKDDRAFEINPNLAGSSGAVIRRASDSINVEPGVDEAAYLSWVEKFKEASHSIENATAELERQRSAPEKKLLKREANKKEAEEKRLAKWEALGYQTLAVKDPDAIPNQNISDAGSLQLVYGDCTNPSKVCPAKPAIIFRYCFLGRNVITFFIKGHYPFLEILKELLYVLPYFLCRWLLQLMSSNIGMLFYLTLFAEKIKPLLTSVFSTA